MENGCDDSKPGDLTDRLLFPWLSTARIFNQGEAPPLAAYDAFYREAISENPGKTYAIIVMNSEVCVTSCTMIVDIHFIPDLGKFKTAIDECLTTSEEDTPIIAIYLSLAWIEDVRQVGVDYPTVAKSTYPQKFPGYKNVVIGTLKMHANMLIVDRVEKTLERFEPNRLPYEDRASDDRHKAIDETIENDILPLLGEGFRYCNPQSFCPRGGPQEEEDELCAAWSFFYLHLRLTNPNLSRREITHRMKGLPTSPHILIDYMDVLKNTYEALMRGSKIYSSKNKLRLEELSKEFSRRHFGWVVKYTSTVVPIYVELLHRVLQNFSRSKIKSMYWNDVFRSRAAWIADGKLQYLMGTSIML